MASKCSDKLTNLGFGYIGELDSTEFEKLRTRVLTLLESREKLEVKISEIKKKQDANKDNLELKKQFENLSIVAKLVDDFITAIKPNEMSDKSPLPIAAKYLTLSKAAANSYIIDIDIKLEGLSIIKENLFTGQQLRLSATAITWYRLYNKTGKILKADVFREMAKPIQVDLRGENANNDFWSK